MIKQVTWHKTRRLEKMVFGDERVPRLRVAGRTSEWLCGGMLEAKLCHSLNEASDVYEALNQVQALTAKPQSPFLT